MTKDGKLDIEDLKLMSVPTIPNVMAAEVLRMDPGRLAQYARDGELNWEVMAPKDSSRVYHNRESFIRFWTGEPAKEPDPPEKTDSDRLDELIELIRVQNTMLMEINAFIRKAAGAATPTD